MGRTREQHNPHRGGGGGGGGTKEKHNSHKQQSRETKRRPMTTELTSHSGDQTLKLHRLRTQAISKAGRNMRVEYNTPHQREAVIYKEAWTPEEFTQSAQILHKPALKCARFPMGRDIKEPCGIISKEPF